MAGLGVTAVLRWGMVAACSERFSTFALWDQCDGSLKIETENQEKGMMQIEN